MGVEDPAILYDNECRLCNGTVKFLKGRNFLSGTAFLPSGDRESENLLRIHNIPRELTGKTVIYIDNKKIYIKSTAIIKALQRKGGLWRLAGLFRIVPLFIRDFVYDWIAFHR